MPNLRRPFVSVCQATAPSMAQRARGNAMWDPLLDPIVPLPAPRRPYIEPEEPSAQGVSRAFARRDALRERRGRVANALPHRSAVSQCDGAPALSPAGWHHQVGLRLQYCWENPLAMAGGAHRRRHLLRRRSRCSDSRRWAAGGGSGNSPLRRANPVCRRSGSAPTVTSSLRGQHAL